MPWVFRYLEIAKAPLSPVVLNIAVRKDAARILNAASSFFWLEEGGSISVPSATIEQFAVARKTKAKRERERERERERRATEERGIALAIIKDLRYAKMRPAYRNR